MATRASSTKFPRDQTAEQRRLAPDFAGFRSAVCAGDRAGALDAGRLAALLALLADGPGPAQAAALAAHG